jgi:hypothetical protein
MLRLMGRCACVASARLELRPCLLPLEYVYFAAHLLDKPCLFEVFLKQMRDFFPATALSTRYAPHRQWLEVRYRQNESTDLGKNLQQIPAQFFNVLIALPRLIEKLHSSALND